MPSFLDKLNPVEREKLLRGVGKLDRHKPLTPPKSQRRTRAEIAREVLETLRVANGRGYHVQEGGRIDYIG